MKKYSSLILIIFGIINGIDALAENGVRLLCRPCQDSILLRWAPTDKQIWDLGNQYGYVVERYTILRQGQLLPNSVHVLLTSTPQKPAPLPEWERYEDDNYVATAAQCIFNEPERLPMVSPKAIAERYQQEQNRFSLALFAADQSVLTARLSGLYLADKTASPNEKYLYKIHIPVPDTILHALSLSPLDTAFVFTGISEYQPLPAPFEFLAQWNDRKVLLSWNILYMSHLYNSYRIEKSQDGQHFVPAGSNAFVQTADEGVSPEYAYHTDSLDNNETTWHYRVRGVSAFGETSPPSNIVTGHGRLPIATPPVITDKGVINNREIFLAWSYPDEMNEHITGFRLYRSSKPTGAKEKIYESENSQERRFTDRQPEMTNYYVLSVFDKETEMFSAGHTYAELIDSIPPAEPSGFVGHIDSTGRVNLHWNRNRERDIDGYRVYRANRPDMEFILISPSVVKDTLFADSVSLKTLTKHIYYRLRAVDLRQNHSNFGQVLELKRPDIIPPVAPLIKSIEAQKGKLLITWINSSSDDVVRHHIYRKLKNDTAFVWLSAVEKQSTYLDNTVEAGETYIYQVKAEDDSGLFSPPSSPVQQHTLGEKTESIHLKKQESTAGVTLTWTLKTKKETTRILIYKATGDDPLQLYTNTTGNTFTDPEASTPGKIFRYRIKAIYDDETSSALSNEVTIKM